MQDKQNRASRTVVLPSLQDKTLEQAMELLFAHQKNCQKTGRYMQAELAKKQLIKMKSELQKQRKDELLQSFDKERSEVEAAHLEEMSDFNTYWDGKFMEYQTEAEKIENQTLQKHKHEEEEFAQVVNESIPTTKKQTSEIINLRRVEQQLARAEEYVQAHKIQRQIQDVERRQNQKWGLMRQNKIRNLFLQLQNKQEIELSALRQKITQGFDEQKRIRHVEQEKLVQKFQNFMNELTARHNQEIIRLQKSFRLQSTMSFSRSQATSRVLQSQNV